MRRACYRDLRSGPLIRVSLSVRDRLEGKARGIPHLAKNERDMGHPAIGAGIEPQRILKRFPQANWSRLMSSL